MKQTLSKATAFLSTREGGGSGALDRKSAIDVFGEAKSFVWRHSSYKTQTKYIVIYTLHFFNFIYFTTYELHDKREKKTNTHHNI